MNCWDIGGDFATNGSELQPPDRLVVELNTYEYGDYLAHMGTSDFATSVTAVYKYYLG